MNQQWTERDHRRTAVVAGGAGFIGSHLCEALLKLGYHVICADNLFTGTPANADLFADNPDFTFIEHDVTAPLKVRQKVDVVFNLACPASPPHYQADPVHTMLTSVVGTSNLLTLAEAHGARFLQASTSEVYGDPEEHPQREEYWGHVNPTGPRACYDEGKRAAEALCFDMLRAGRVDVRVARIFNTYGPRMRPDDGRIVSNLIVQALRGEALTIYGTGEQTRSFCYVADLVDGLVRLCMVERNPATPVNLGNPGEFTILELAQMVVKALRARARIVHLPLPTDDPQRRRPDISRARRLLRWAPRVPLAEGLPPTIAWFAGMTGPLARHAAAAR
jgi:UDP-glucuronate decarboxylase